MNSKGLKELPPAPSMVDVVRALSETYDDHGVAMWLGNYHHGFQARAVDVCRTAEGRREVMAWADMLTGEAAT